MIVGEGSQGGKHEEGENFYIDITFCVLKKTHIYNPFKFRMFDLA